MQAWIDRESPHLSTDAVRAADSSNTDVLPSLNPALADTELTYCQALLDNCIQSQTGSPLINSLQKVSLLGAGTYGIVFQAITQTGTQVAIKILRPSAQFSHTLRQRFELEGAALQRCRFPGIVPVLEVGQLTDVPYIVMEFAAGGNLAELLTDLPQPLAIPSAVRIMVKLAEALHLAHQQGIIHRDLKPSNILLRRRPEQPDFVGEVWLCDFGLARDLSGDTKITLTGTTPLVGTVAYMSPEQALGRSWETTTASDIFSLGVICFELLTLVRPFQAASRVETLYQIAFTEPSTLRSLRHEVARDLEAIVQKCLAKRPSERYSSAAALAADLNAWQAGQPITARVATGPERLVQWAARSPVIAGLSLLLVLTIVSGTAVSTWLYIRTQKLLVQSERERARADQNLETALDTVKNIGQFVAEKTLLDVPKSNEKRLEIHLKLLESFKQFAEQTGHDTPSQKRLSIAYHYAASAAHQVPGNADLELDLRNRQAAVLERLIEREPTNAWLHFDMFHNRFPLGVREGGGKYYLEAEPHLRRAIELDPQRVEFQDALAGLLIQIALHVDQADGSQRAAYLAEAMSIARQNIMKYPGKINFQKPLIHAQLTLAGIARKQGNYSEAIKLSREVLQRCDEQLRPTDEPYTRMSFQTWAYGELVRTLIEQKDAQALPEPLQSYVQHTMHFAQQQTKYGREAIAPIKACIQAAQLFHQADQPTHAQECLRYALDLKQLEFLAQTASPQELEELNQLVENCQILLGRQ